MLLIFIVTMAATVLVQLYLRNTYARWLSFLLQIVIEVFNSLFCETFIEAIHFKSRTIELVCRILCFS